MLLDDIYIRFLFYNPDTKIQCITEIMSNLPHDTRIPRPKEIPVFEDNANTCHNAEIKSTPPAFHPPPALVLN